MFLLSQRRGRSPPGLSSALSHGSCPVSLFPAPPPPPKKRKGVHLLCLGQCIRWVWVCGRRAEGEPVRPEAGLMDSVHPRPLSQPPQGCWRQGQASLGACCACPLPPAASLSSSSPTCPACTTPTLAPMAHFPTPARTSCPARSGPAPHPQLLKESLVPKPAGSSC